MIVKLLSIAVVIFITTGLGAYGLSVAIGLLDTLIDPTATKDPQYVMSFMVGVPIGGILGGTAGYVLMPPEKTKRKAGIIFSVVGGVNMILCLGMGFLSAGSRDLSLQEFLWTIASPWCLVPLIASSAMLARGIYLLTRENHGVIA
jgi:hypothetical protein